MQQLEMKQRLKLVELFNPVLSSCVDNCLDIDEGKLKHLFFREGVYCRSLEIKILSYALHQVQGDYIEIGVQEGYTMLNIARNNRDRVCYGVDFPENILMHKNQMCEKPTPTNVAHACRWENNFMLILHNSWTVTIPKGVGMVFIDADHTYQGVKNDTENVLNQVEPGTLIFWHDYHNNLHNDYLRVNEYIDSEIRKIIPIFFFKNTWMICGIKN